MTKCWRCNSILFLHPATGNCFICGYSQDADYIQNYVEVKQAIHDRLDSNPKTNGDNPEYAYRRKYKWSMED
jgi:hypothetical protein